MWRLTTSSRINHSSSASECYVKGAHPQCTDVAIRKIASPEGDPREMCALRERRLDPPDRDVPCGPLLGVVQTLVPYRVSFSMALLPHL